MTADGVDATEEKRREFAAFVSQHARDLSRLAYLMVGDKHAGEDLAAEALLATWQHWDRARGADQPLAYVRRILVNQASGHFRRRAQDLAVSGHLKLMATRRTYDPDGAAVMDVRSALMHLPPRRRACLVLRHCFELTEHEVAEALGVRVGTVKSQTSKALAQFRREIDDASAVPGPLEPDAVAASRRRRGNDEG